MGVYAGPEVAENSLVLALDAGNLKSYPGSGTTAFDLSPLKYNFTLTNGVTISSSNIGVFSFDGVDDYLNTTSIASSFWNGGSWTVSLWAYFNTVNTGLDNGMIGHGTASTNNGLHLGERNQRIYFGFFSNDLQSNQVLNATTWYNIVWTFNFSTKLKQIYLNAQFQTSGGTVGYSGTGNDTRIGNYTYTNRYTNGFLNNIAFYNRVLTAQEIQQNYIATKSRFGL